MSSKKLVFAVCGVLAVALGVACGQSTCERSGSVNQGLATKASPCSSSDGGLSFSTSFDQSRCESGITNCSAEDMKIVNAQLDCLDKVGTCSKGNELAWFGSVLSCSADSNKLSAACASAVSGK